jgi:hypothetical protein
MRLLEVQWSWALILVCKVALILLANPPCLYRANDVVGGGGGGSEVATQPFPTILALNINIHTNICIYTYHNKTPQKGPHVKESLPNKHFTKEIGYNCGKVGGGLEVQKVGISWETWGRW